MNISFKLFQSYFYYYILHNLGSVVTKIPGVCPKDDLYDNCCTPCVCTTTKDLLDVETMFTTIGPSKGVKQCLESDKRTEGVKCCLQPDSKWLPSMIVKPSHHSVQNDVLKKKETPDRIQEKDMVINFIIHLRLGYQTVLRDQLSLMKTVYHQRECGELLEIV